MRKLAYWLIGLALIGIVIGAVMLLNNTREISWEAAENALCEPTLADAAGMDINSAFRFTFTSGVSANAVRRFLVVEPAMELNFHQGFQSKEVLAVPMEPLQSGQVYRFALQTESETLRWAFQTKQEWRVEATVPSMADIAVSPESSLEIYFNQSIEVELTALPEHFQIEPQVAGRFEQEGNCLRFFPESSLEPLTVYKVTLLAGLPTKDSDLTLGSYHSFAFETGNADGSAPQALWTIFAPFVFTPEQVPIFICDFFDRDNSPAQITDGGKSEPSVNITIYHYENSEAFARDILSARRQTFPGSYTDTYPQGADTSALARLSSHEMHATAIGSVYNFSLPVTLPVGCYLLQADYRGQSRDIRFQVSHLSAFLETSAEESLFWVHTSQGGPAAGCQITHINSGNGGRADKDGLLRLKLDHERTAIDADGQVLVKQDVFLLCHGLEELVWADFLSCETDEAQTEADIWRYVVLSQDIYKSGDTLEFWGYMRRRDDVDWDWNRVTVYICAAEAADEPVLQDFAPLICNIFQGSITLPRLLPGPYELQIWQSGQMLISKSFMVDTMHVSLPDDTANDTFGLVGDKGAYALEEEYTLDFRGLEGEAATCLFIKSTNGTIKEVIVEEQPRHRGIFSKDDLGGAYWQAVVLRDRQRSLTPPFTSLMPDSQYMQTPFYSLLPESFSYNLHIEAVVWESMVRFSVEDVSANIPANVTLLAIIAPPGRSTDDAAAVLYAPNRLSRLLNGANIWKATPAPASWGKESVCFESLEVNKNGRAELKLPTHLPPGEWQLYVWAVADDTLPMAGYTQIPLSTVMEDELSTPSFRQEQKGEWLFISSRARLQALELLARTRIVPKGDIQEHWAALYAEHVLAYYCPEDFPLTAGDLLPNWHDYQHSEGGISQKPDAPADMFLSLLTAILENQGVVICDKAALSRYLKVRATIPPSQIEQAMALASLAALDQPVLQEIKLMLNKENLPPLARACLICGLICAGDIQVAKAAFRELIDLFISDATTGVVYLEGWEADNIRLNQIGAILAAACGETHTAYTLLQYLQNERSSNTLITALMAGTLLQHCYAAPASAALRTSYIYRRVDIEGFEDFCLKLSDFSLLNLDNVSGDIDFTIIER